MTLLLSVYISFCIPGLKFLRRHCCPEYLIYWDVILKICQRVWFTYCSKDVYSMHTVCKTLWVLAFFKSQKMCGFSKNNPKLEHNLRFLLEAKKAMLKGRAANLAYYMGRFLIRVWGVGCIRRCLNIACKVAKLHEI